MTAASAQQYTARAGDPARDRDAVLSVWRGNLGHEDRIAAKYDWFYLACPHGPPLLQLLSEDTGAGCLGTACAGRRRLRLRGRDLAAGVLVDLVVLPEHRSLGPALMLQHALIAASEEGSLDVLYGFPNPKAVALCKRVGYQHLTDLVRHARVLRHERYLRARMPGWLALPTSWLADAAIALRDRWQRRRDPRLRTEWSERADARMDALWHGAPQGDGVIGVRDLRHARWRFDESPLAGTRYLWLHCARSGEPQAWLALREQDTALHVLDYWSVDGANGLSPGHVRALLAATRTAGAASVSVEISGNEAQLRGWKDNGFHARGSRPVFARWNHAMVEPPAWFLTSADEDE